MIGHQQHRERPLANEPAVSAFDLPRRRNSVAAVSTLIALTAIAWAISLMSQPGVAGWEPTLFAICGAALLAATLAVLRNRLDTGVAANLAAGVVWLLITERLLLIAFGDAYADPAVATFLPVHGALPLLSLLFVVVQPYPRSIRLAFGAWLVQASIVTATLWPFLDDAQPRPYLYGTLVFVWLLMAIYLALLALWTRQQRELLETQARLAASEQAVRIASATSELRFRTIFEQATAGIGLVGPDRCWIDVNERMAELTGYPVAELRGMSLCQILPAEDRDAGVERMTVFMQDNAAPAQITIERRWLKRDGSTVWVANHLRRIPAAAGQPATALLMSIDISDRRQAEAAAALKQREMRAIFEQAGVGIAMLDEDGRWLTVNRRICAIVGRSEAELLRTDFQTLTHPDDLELDLVQAGQVAAGEIPGYTMEKRYLRPDASIVWVRLHVARIDATANTPMRYVSVVEDISEQKRAEHEALAHQQVRDFHIAALRDSQTRFQSIFEQAAVGIVMIDAQGNWLMVNQRFREIVGYDAEELRQHSCEDITEARDRAAEAVLRTRLIAGEISDYNFEKRYRRRDGKPVWVSLHARRLDDLDASGGQSAEVRLSLVVVDITERRKAEAEIRKLNADLERRVALRTDQLNDTVRNWAHRNQELRLLGEMMALLPAARDIAESSRIIECYLPQIFARCGGAVWLEGVDEPQRMSLLGHWGRVRKSPLSLMHDDCWGIRRGQTLRVEDPADPLLCPHLHGSHDPLSQRPHACVPVVALGETVGLIHLEWSEHVDAAEMPPDPVLMRNVAEQVGLAIGNVRLREELRRQAVRDPLTGLYNRRHFDETLKNRIAEQARNGRGFALLMIDIDHFKRINDEHGHDIGDEVLRETASLLARTVRSDEAAFRLGGEEFVMLVDDSGGRNGQAAGCAERVRREIEAMRVQRRDRLLPPITVSIGLARYPKDVPHGASPLQRADAALYAAKRTGRNRVCMAGAIAGHEGVTALVKG